MVASLILASILVQDQPVAGRVTDGKNALEDVAVWLEGRVESKPTKAKIDQKDLRFVPRILVVPKGSTVSFPNNDTVFHNVFAQFEAKTFDLGMYPRGQSKSVTFDKPGIVSVLCNIHAEMSAYIVVVDSPYYVKSDKKGTFTLKAAPGQYTLRAWHESGKTAKQVVTIGNAPLTVDVTVAKK
jgi:plastocyanin